MTVAISGVAISGIGAIADRFDHVLLDQWGALHEGKAVFPAARDAVLKLHAAGRRVLVLSNSGRPGAVNEKRLADLGLEAAAYDGVLSSGEVTWIGFKERRAAPFRDLGQRCFLISRGADTSVIAGLDLEAVPVEAADFILLSGLDDAKAQPSLWAATFDLALARQLPMLCANPDITMFDATGGLIPGPGALARVYAERGGTVFYVGKPHAPIFVAALQRLGNPDPGRVLMIGDSLDHDIAGGRAAGVLTLLLTAGIHKEQVRGAADIVQAVRDLAGSDARTPHWFMEHLAW